MCQASWGVARGWPTLPPTKPAAGCSAQDREERVGGCHGQADWPYCAGRNTKGRYMGSTSARCPFPLGPHSPAHSVGELSHAA